MIENHFSDLKMKAITPQKCHIKNITVIQLLHGKNGGETKDISMMQK